MIKKIGIVVLLSFGFTGCYTHVGAGNIGAEVDSCENGGVNPNPVGVGYHFTGPCTTIEEFPVTQQTLILALSKHEGGIEDESITVNSSEGMPIGIDAALAFTAEPIKVPIIYGRFKSDIDKIAHTYLRQTVREFCQKIFADYTAQDVVSTKKEIARATIEDQLRKRLAPEGFIINQFTINETRPPQQVINAIQNKGTAVQQAQQAEQELRKTQAEAAKDVAAAEGAAKAAMIKAKAEADSNRLIDQSLTPALVQYKLAGKWNGQLPSVTSGGNMLLNFDTNKK